MILPESVTDATRGRLQSLEENGCAEILVTMVGEPKIMGDGDDFPAGDAYYSGRMTLPSGATVEGQGLTPETAAVKLAEAVEARLP